MLLGMKNRLKLLGGNDSEWLITTFGRARLVRQSDGTVELRGGEPRDHTDAKEWVSLFMHDAALRFVDQP